MPSKGVTRPPTTTSFGQCRYIAAPSALFRRSAKPLSFIKVPWTRGGKELAILLIGKSRLACTNVLVLLRHALLVLWVTCRIEGQWTGGPQMCCPIVTFGAARKITICEVQARN